jgi:hypothetical protein
VVSSLKMKDPAKHLTKTRVLLCQQTKGISGSETERYSERVKFNYNGMESNSDFNWEHKYYFYNGICDVFTTGSSKKFRNFVCRTLHTFESLPVSSGLPRNFFRGGGGVQQIKSRTEGRQNRDQGAVIPSQGFRPICKWVKPVFLLGS